MPTKLQRTLIWLSEIGRTSADQARSDLGLGNVDNTNDADKPVSTATQQALIDPLLYSPATAITVPVSPTALTFSILASRRVYGFINSDFLIGQLDWQVTDTRDLVNGGAANDTRVSTGRITLPVQGNANGLQFAYSGAFQAPWVGAMIHVERLGGTTTRQVGVGFVRSGDGTLAGTSSTDCAYAVYDAVAGTIKTYFKKAGGSVTVGSGAVSVTLTGPFDLGLSFLPGGVTPGVSLVTWVRELGQEWRQVGYTVLNTTAFYDVRLPAVISGFNPSLFVITQGSGDTVLGESRAGYLAGIGSANYSPVCFEDGTPITQNGKHFLVGSIAHASGRSTANDNIQLAGGALFEVDLKTQSCRPISMLFFSRGGLVMAENSGDIIYDRTIRKWRLFFPDWGDFNSTNRHINEYQIPALKSGINVLTGGTVLSTPEVDGQGYDPCIRRIGGTWYVAYSTNTSGGSPFTSALASGSSLTSLSLVAKLTGLTAAEGSKLISIGGTPYWLFSDRTTNPAIWRIYSLAGASVGSISDPVSNLATTAGNPSVGSHPCIIPVTEGGLTSFYMVGFSGTTFSAWPLSWGNTVFLKAAQVQTGSDYGEISADHILFSGLSAGRADRPYSGTTAAQISNTPSGGVAATTVQAAINELDTEKAAADLSNAAAVAALGVHRLVILGDSLSAPNAQPGTTGNWPYLLTQRAGLRGWTLVNNAVSGQTAATIAANLSTQLTPYLPSITKDETWVAVFAGTNDLAGSAASIYANLKVIWAAARTGGARVMAFTLPYRGDTSNATLDAVNDLIVFDRSLYDACYDINHFMQAGTGYNFYTGRISGAAGDAGTNAFTKVAHGYTNGQVIVVGVTSGLSGVTNFQKYYVIGAAADTFQISTAAGGSVVSLGTNGTADCGLAAYYPDLLHLTPVTNGYISREVEMLLTTGEISYSGRVSWTTGAIADSASTSVDATIPLLVPGDIFDGGGGRQFVANRWILSGYVSGYDTARLVIQNFSGGSQTPSQGYTNFRFKRP